MTQDAEWGGEGTRLELQPERRRWEVSDCPELKGSVKRRTLLQKLVGWAEGRLRAGDVCNPVCVGLTSRRTLNDDQNQDDTREENCKK